MQTVLVLFVAVATAGYVLFNHFLAVTPDPREPPFVSSRIPVIGHIIGLIRYKGYYYNKLRYYIMNYGRFQDNTVADTSTEMRKRLHPYTP